MLRWILITRGATRARHRLRVFAITRQRLFRVRGCCDDGTQAEGHGTGQIVLLHFEYRQSGQIGNLRGDGSVQLVGVKPHTLQRADFGQLGGNGARDGGIGQGQTGQVGQETQLCGKGTKHLIVIEPHGNCDKQEKETIQE